MSLTYRGCASAAWAGLTLVLAGTSPALSETHVPAGTIVGQVWTKASSPYLIEGNLLVAGSGLRIEPGVHVEFQGNFTFEVAGRLTVAGVAADSVVFTAATPAGWDGIYFNEGLSGSYLRYCRIDGSVNSGIRIVNARPTIADCWIRKNAASRGAGVRVSGTTEFVITRCKITNNTVAGGASRGGGIDIAAGSATIVDCTISSNHITGGGTSAGGGVAIDGSLVLDNCVVEANTVSAAAGSFATCYGVGAGVYANGLTTMRNTVVRSNTASASTGSFGTSVAQGGGIYLTGSQRVDVRNCNITSNIGQASAGSFGATYTQGLGFYSSSTDTTVVANCTVAYNNPNGVFRQAGTLRIVNSIVYFNTSAQIEGTADASYSNVQGGFSGAGNIAVNPSFAAAPLDLHLVDGSPCIDAGTFFAFTGSLQPDTCCPPSFGTWQTDLGAYGGPGGCGWLHEPVGPPGTMGFGGCTATDADGPLTNRAATPLLLQNSPNPFNPTTTLRFTVPATLAVDLTIYNAAGQVVIALLDGVPCSTGEHSAVWNGCDAANRRVASGAYYACLTAGGTTKVSRMILLK